MDYAHPNLYPMVILTLTLSLTLTLTLTVCVEALTKCGTKNLGKRKPGDFGYLRC